MQNDCVHCKQTEGNADRLNVSTALEVSNPVLVVATDTDILVMLVNQASGIHGGVYMGRGLTSCVNVLDIQEQIGTVNTHLFFVHAVSGCDSVSALFGKGEKTVLHKMIDHLENAGYLEVFNHIDSTKEDIAVAGEQFLITLYGSYWKTTLDALRYKVNTYYTCMNIDYKQVCSFVARYPVLGIAQSATYLHIYPLFTHGTHSNMCL